MSQNTASNIEPETQAETAEDRRAMRKAQRRADIVDAALRVFSRVGFAAAKIDDVADEAGVSKGTLYLYFDSKERLFEGMVMSKLLPLLEEAETIPDKVNGSAEDVLRATMRFLYGRVLVGDRRHIMRLILAEGPNFPELTAFYHQNILQRGQKMIRRVLDHGAARGEFRCVESHGILQNVMAGAIAATMWKLVFDAYDPIDIESYAETHIDLLLNGLKVD